MASRKAQVERPEAQGGPPARSAGWRLFARTVAARAYPRLVMNVREKWWLVFDIALPLVQPIDGDGGGIIADRWRCGELDDQQGEVGVCGCTDLCCRTQMLCGMIDADDGENGLVCHRVFSS